MVKIVCEGDTLEDLEKTVEHLIRHVKEEYGKKGYVHLVEYIRDYDKREEKDIEDIKTKDAYIDSLGDKVTAGDIRRVYRSDDYIGIALGRESRRRR